MRKTGLHELAGFGYWASLLGYWPAMQRLRPKTSNFLDGRRSVGGRIFLGVLSKWSNWVWASCSILSMLCRNQRRYVPVPGHAEGAGHPKMTQVT